MRKTLPSRIADLNYSDAYDRLMERARNRLLHEDIYRERHHVEPRSIGGTDEPSNIVDLTGKEHFVAHWLLTKFKTGSERIKMLHAFGMMSRLGELSGVEYEACRKAISEARRNASPETLKRMSERQKGEKAFWYGKKMPEETKAKMSEAAKGRKKSLEHRINISRAKKGVKKTPEHIEKIASQKRGVSLSAEHKAKVSEAIRLNWERRRQMYGTSGHR
jgi:hypothetical protein